MKLKINKRPEMPNQEIIVEYWKEKIDVYNDQCFACGSPQPLDRCHIIPFHKGGKNDLSNLHLLCTRCHIESEGLEIYYFWFQEKRKTFKNPLLYISDKIEQYGFDIKDFKELLVSSFHPRIIHQEVMLRIYWQKYIAPLLYQ